MDILLIIFQIFFLIMGILGGISSAVTSFISIKIATVIYWMSAVISFHRGSWVPLIIGFIALLTMRYFRFEPSGKEARDNTRQQLGLNDISFNILSNKDNKSLPKMNQPTQQEFWDGIRESGVTQAEINSSMRLMPIIVPMNNEVMAHISQEGKKELLCFLNELGHRRLVSIDECIAKLTDFGFNCIELEYDIGVEIEGISVQTSTLVNDEWVLSAFDILRPLMSLSEVKWESNMTGQGFLLRDLLNKLGERWRLEVDFL